MRIKPLRYYCSHTFPLILVSISRFENHPSSLLTPIPKLIFTPHTWFGRWFKRLPTSWQLWTRIRSVLTIDCPVSPASCAGYIEAANWTRPHIMWDPRPVVLACLLSPHLHHGKPQLHQTLHRVGSSASKKVHPKVRNHGEGPYYRAFF